MESPLSLRSLRSLSLSRDLARALNRRLLAAEKVMVGQPPPNKPSTPGAKGGGGGSGGTPGGHQAPVRDDVEQELLRELLVPEPQEWDFM